MYKGGVDGVQQVIASGSFAELSKQPSWSRPDLRPRPASPEQLAQLRLPGDRPLPETWLAWLAFDTAKLPNQRARCAHHVKHLLGGEWEVQFPKDTLRRSGGRR